MTKEDLEQLCDLREEISEIEYKIARLSSKGSRIVSDKVQASSREFPYVQTTVKIEGVDFAGGLKNRRQIMQKRLLLQQRKDKAAELDLRITKYINSISDSGIRRMIDYKYIEGYTWEKIGRIFHCDRTTAEKRVSNYLKEHPEE